jgi:putative tricarboxylic transport membrane protein
VSCIVATVFGLMVTRWLAMITTIDVHILVPVVTALSLVGAYVLKEDMADVAVCVVFGIVGYLMIKYRYPRVTMVIALVLGDLAERSFFQTYKIADGDLTIFFTRTVSLVLVLLLVAALLVPVARYARARRAAAARGGAAP